MTLLGRLLGRRRAAAATPAVPSADAVDILARTIYGEARGETHGGRVAVANVVMNRVARPGWWGVDVATVCRKPRQFACWTPGDPNRRKVIDAGPADPAFVACRAIARAAVAGALPDVTFGATHYHARHARPGWSQGHAPVIEIGRHLFFNDVR